MPKQIAISYIRFSTIEQLEGTSTKRQRQDCAAHAEKKGWAIEDVRIDEGKSAFTGKNREVGSALRQFEDEVLTGQHFGKVLLVERLDRISRQGHEETGAFIRSLGDLGVSVATVDGDEFYEAGKKLDLMQVIKMLLKAESAHEESVAKSNRLKRRYEIRYLEAQVSGKALTKNCPPWLKVTVSRTFVVIAERAALVVRIFELADAGHGALTIARILNKDGVPTWDRFKNRRPKTWDRSFIRKLLANRAVTGEYQPHRLMDGKRAPFGEPFQHYPVIVDAALFERVRANAPEREKTKGGGKSPTVANLVSGLARCGECMGKMKYLKSRSEGAVYRTKPAGNLTRLKHESARLACASAYNHGQCTNRTGVTYYGFERALLDSCLHIALDDAAFVRRDELATVIVAVAEKRRECDIALERARALWGAFSLKGSPMAMELATEAEHEADRLQRELTALEKVRLAAAGKASSEEHLSRIAEFRRHLYADDLRLRALHRKKVAEAFRSVISVIFCDADRTATVVLAGGLAALQIKQGKVVRQGNTVRMFSGGDLSSLRVPERMAQTVHERITKTLIANGSMRGAA